MGHSKFEIIRFGMIYVVLILLEILISAFTNIVSVKTHGRLENQLQLRVFSRLSLTNWMHFTGYHSGDLMTRLTSDVRIVTDGLVNLITGIISAGFHFVVAFIVLFQYDAKLAIFAFLFAPFLILFSRIFGKRLKRSHLQIQEAESQCRELQTESIQNMIVIKTFQQEMNIGKKIHELMNKRLHWQVGRSILSTVGSSILSLGYRISYLTAFGWGAYRIYQGTGTFGTMTLFMQIVGHIQGPLTQLAYSYPRLISLLASTCRIQEIINLPGETIQELPIPDGPIGIELDGMSFAYRGKIWIFDKQSLVIEPGKIVGISGLSGEGKTTFIQLLLALLYPQEGEIYFINPNGERVRASAETRAYMAYVPQGDTLFSGTIAENLRIGCETVSEGEMIQVLREVGAWEFIEPLPKRLETRIGEKGFGLSEGQLQRVTIARALLRKVPILILDEVTSALDMENEKKILDTIRTLPHRPTCMIITHRASVLEICDQILTVKHSEIEWQNS